jgi:hypothetical protein
MRYATRRIQWAIAACVVMGAPALVSAQDATPPPRETPRPQDIDPAVNTSATPPAESEEPAKPAPSGAARSGQIEPRGDPNTSSEPAAGNASSGSAASGNAASNSGATAATPGSTLNGASGNTQSGAASSSAPSTTARQGTAPSSNGKPKGKAVDRLELDTTQITGNRELPKVLYIVPWKRADLGDLVGKPVNSLLDEVLTPVDRDVFKRENRYYRALAPAEGQPEGANGATPAAAAPGAATSTGSAAPPARDER